jgi:hypothetical protein
MMVGYTLPQPCHELQLPVFVHKMTRLTSSACEPRTYSYYYTAQDVWVGILGQASVGKQKIDKVFFAFTLGKLIATGSADCSIKVKISVSFFFRFVLFKEGMLIFCDLYTTFFLQVLDVDRMIVKTTTPSSKDHGMMGMENHPVIRTLYDHVEVWWLKSLFCANSH